MSDENSRLPWWFSGKEYNAGDAVSIPGLGRSPGERNGNPLQYSCLGNPVDRGAWWATVHGVGKSWALLSDLTTTKEKGIKYLELGYIIRVVR